MPFSLTASPPLSGTVSMPGDRLTTLGAMAFGFFAGGVVTIEHPSGYPEVTRFREFLADAGSSFTDTPGGFTMTPPDSTVRLVVDDRVPNDVLHIFLAGAAARDGAVLRTGDNRQWATALSVIALLRDMGITVDGSVQDGGDLTILGDVIPPAERAVKSRPAFEAAVALAMASGANVKITCASGLVSHVFRLIAALGWSGEETVDESRAAELDRRQRKAAGLPQLETVRLLRSGMPTVVHVPGDTMFAAALCGCAATIQKSDMTVRGVMIEQGRRGFVDVLRRMGAGITVRKTSAPTFETGDISIRWSVLSGVHVTAEQARTCVGELPVLSSVAAFAGGESVIADTDDGFGCGRETFAALARGLELLGAYIGDYADGIAVRGGTELIGDLVDAGDRYDLALAYAVAGSNAGGETTVFGFDVDDYPVGPFRALLREATGQIM